MKKKVLTILLAFAVISGVTACGGENNPPDQKGQEVKENGESEDKQEEPAEPTDLTGKWRSENKDGTYQEAVITEDSISIDWIMEEDETTAVYWVGTYSAPTEEVTEYTWTSSRNVEETEYALLASTDDTKDFTYKDGVITYDVSAMGVTQKVSLEKVE